MAVLRDRPYVQFNFLVDIGTGDSNSVQGGFQEVSAMTGAVEVVEYRTGNSKDNAPMLLPGLASTGTIVLRRGLIGSLDLFDWFQQVRNGDQGARRTVTIMLQNEDRSEVVMTWRLLRAFPARHTCGPLDALSGDVVVEELELVHESLEIE